MQRRTWGLMWQNISTRFYTLSLRWRRELKNNLNFVDENLRGARFISFCLQRTIIPPNTVTVWDHAGESILSYQFSLATPCVLFNTLPFHPLLAVNTNITENLGAGLGEIMNPAPFGLLVLLTLVHMSVKLAPYLVSPVWFRQVLMNYLKRWSQKHDFLSRSLDTSSKPRKSRGSVPKKVRCKIRALQ